MIYPKPLVMRNKSDKQIIDGLTARNLEMHITNCELIKEKKEMQKELKYLETKNSFLQETLLQDSTTQAIINQQSNKDTL